MVREESLKHGLLTRNIEDVIRRTPPHLLNQQNRKHPNMSDSTPICQKIGGSSMNPTRAISEKYNQLGLLPTSTGDLSSLLRSKTAYTGVVPQAPELLSTTPKTSAISGSPYKKGTPRATTNDNPSEHMRLLLGGRKPGGSNSRTLDYQLPHQLPSFHHGVPDTNGNSDQNHPQHQQLAQHHQTGRNEQLPLPSHRSSHHTSNSNIHHTSSRTRAASSAVQGKCPAVSNPAQSFFLPPPSPPSMLGKHPTTSNPSQSFFQPPPSVLGKQPTTSNPVRSFFQPPPSNADGIEPWCKLETDELLSLVLSMGTPEFLAMSEKVLRSGSSLHDPPCASSAQIPVGNGSGMDKGKGKGVSSYWDLDDMVEMMESVKRKTKVTGQPVLDFTWLSALDFGPGSSKNKRS